MLRRTPSAFWVANYFCGVKKPNTFRGEKHHTGRRPTAKPRYRAPAAPSLPSRRSDLATAHRSVLELVAASLAQLQRAEGHVDSHRSREEEYGAHRFQVMSEVVPSLKLVLPLPTPRAASLTRSPEHAPLSNAPEKQQDSSNFRTSRYVAIPTERIPTLQQATVPQIVKFLHQTSPLRSSDHVDVGSSVSDAHDRSLLGSPVFNLEEISMMLQLAVRFDIRDVDLTLRVYSELERNIQEYRSTATSDDVSIRKSEETTRKQLANVPGAEQASLHHSDVSPAIQRVQAAVSPARRDDSLPCA